MDLPEQNKQEILNLIDYINNNLVKKIQTLTERIEILEQRNSVKFNLELTDDEDTE